MPDPIEISATASFHRRGRTGKLNDLLRAASELVVPAVHAASVDFAIATDRMATHSYVSGDAKLDTYETTIVQEWARYMASHAAFSEYGVAWEARFRTGRRGRPPAVDMVIEDRSSNATARVALIEVKVADESHDPDDLWADAKKLWDLKVKAEDGSRAQVEAAKFVVSIVTGLPEDVTPDQFTEMSRDLAKATTTTWHPRLELSFSAVFPVFRPSASVSDQPMWIRHGVAGFELKASKEAWPYA